MFIKLSKLKDLKYITRKQTHYLVAIVLKGIFMGCGKTQGRQL